MNTIRQALFVLLLLSAGTSGAKTVQSQPGFFSYKAFVQRILSSQVLMAEKGAALKDRLVGASFWEDNGSSYDLIDSNFHKYSGGRGCSPSPNDDYNAPSYRDNSSTFFFEGLQDPASSTLSYDTSYFAANIGSGIMYFRSVKTYDAAGYLATYRLGQALTAGGQPAGESLYQYTYDASRHCIRIMEMGDPFGTGSLTPVGLGVFSKYSSNLKTVDSLYDFDGGEPYEKITYTYNAAGKPTLTFSQKWSGTAWDNEARYIATYDAANRLSTSIHVDWQAGAWLNQAKDSFAYTGTGNTYTWRLTFFWDATSSSFMPGARCTVKLTSFGAMDTLFQYGAGSTVPSGRYVFTYNNYQHLTTLFGYPFTGSGYSARPSEKSYYTYQTYNPTGLNGAAQAFANDDAVLVFPNPATSATLKLHFKDAPTRSPQLSVFNTIGAELLNMKMDPAKDVALSVKELPSGVYYLLLQWDGKIRQLRFAKL